MMKVTCSTLAVLAVLSLNAVVEARIGGQQQRRLEDLALEVVGNNGDWKGKLGLCQGECDEDDDVS